LTGARATLLASDPALWSTVFPELPERTGWLAGLARRAGGPSARVLDVGCATGSLCAALSERGFQVTGVDVNAAAVRAARAQVPQARFAVADMRRLAAGGRYDLLCCIGTTLGYALTGRDLTATLEAFHRSLRVGGTLAIDVLNAIAFLGPRPFRSRTHHSFLHRGRRYLATLEHTLLPREQCMTEQVTWRFGGQVRVDPASRLRLFFPQELADRLALAGFEQVQLFDGYGRRSADFSGRRLVAVARRAPGKDG
jgi:SAM-dependent methyltransferase